MMGPFGRERRQALLKSYAASQGKAADFLIGLVKHVAPGFVDEETRKPLATILVERNHELQTLLGLLRGESFNRCGFEKGKIVEECTQLVPLEGYEFISAETHAELLELAQVYKLDGWQGWRGVDWAAVSQVVADAPSSQDFAQELATLLASPTPPYIGGRAFFKYYVRAVAPKLAACRLAADTSCTLADILAEDPTITVSDVFLLLTTTIVVTKQERYMLSPRDREGVVGEEMQAALRELFRVCHWENKKAPWKGF